MSENTNTTAAPIDLNEHHEPPTDDEIRAHITELKQRGVSVDLVCFQCDEPTDLTVLPEEKDDEHHTVCRDCAKSRLLEAGQI